MTGDASNTTRCLLLVDFPQPYVQLLSVGAVLNRVVPEAIDRTRIEFRAYVWNQKKLGAGAGSALHQVELEDEAIVEAVQRGVHSRFYLGGRYSPTCELGTHHFHRLLCQFLTEPGQVTSADQGKRTLA